MPDLFRFDELTWPEVAALPRETPLLLPLGSMPLGSAPDPSPALRAGLETLPALLKATQPVGLLPSIPFGWAGSELEVREQIFAALVHNLVGNLLEDGFTSVHVLTPPGLDLGAGIPAIVLPRPVPRAICLANRIGTTPLEPGLPHQAAGPLALPADFEKVVILPIGQTEQHGYHAPLSTDTLIIEAIGRGTAQAVPEQAVCLPVFPYGVSTHRRSFPGTFHVGGRAFEDFWLAVVDTLVGGGFKRFYLMSGHGGNSSFLVNMVKYAGEKYPQIFCATAFLYLSGPQGVAALEARRQSGLGGMGHACELETSLILRLRPELIHLERAVDETNFITTPNYYMDWIEGGALTANPPWEDDTRTGAYGVGSLGTAEKGKYWLEAAIAEKVEHVAEIHEQYRRRRERRQQRN
ncbi:MAG: creatininase family protein [Chloroflexi bacterium]|nr:creatininase family protein [Chloroflexota bacterium]